MSVFTASGPLSPDQSKAYAAALIGLLGSQSAPQVLGETPGHLREDLRRIPKAQLGTPEAPGKWSAGMVLAHFADIELVGAYNLRMVLAQDRPSLAPLDQDGWARRLHYEQADPEESFERFAVLRRTNLALWEEASHETLRRVGIHPDRGEETLEVMRRVAAGHDLAHLHQLARIRIILTGH